MINVGLNKYYQRLLYRRREMIAYYCNIAKKSPTDQKRVVIFGQGRTGSTLLEDLICESGFFEKHGELLHHSRGEVTFPVNFIRGLPKRNPHQNFIFHVKVYQLTRDRNRPVDPSVFLNSLYSDGWKIIYLKRRNKIKHVLSNMVANHRGNYHKFDKKKEEISFEIDLDSFVQWVNDRIDFDMEEKTILQGLKFHEVVYEDDLENQVNHQETVNRIMNFLSLKSKPVSTRLRKVNATPLPNLIKNYELFEKRMIQEGWGKFLDERK